MDGLITICIYDHYANVFMTMPCLFNRVITSAISKASRYVLGRMSRVIFSNHSDCFLLEYDDDDHSICEKIDG